MKLSGIFSTSETNIILIGETSEKRFKKNVQGPESRIVGPLAQGCGRCRHLEVEGPLQAAGEEPPEGGHQGGKAREGEGVELGRQGGLCGNPTLLSRSIVAASQKPIVETVHGRCMSSVIYLFFFWLNWLFLYLFDCF